MLFLDLNIRKKVHQMEYPREELIISCEHILEKSYSEYSRMFEIAIGSVELKEGMLLDIKLQTSDLLNEADMIQFHQCLVSLFASRILETEPRNEELRLSVNTELAYVHAIVLKKLINYKTKVNCFNLVLHCGNQVMDMTGGYYVSSTIQE